MKKFINKSVIFYAPSCYLPARDGASIRAYNVFMCSARLFRECVYCCFDGVLRSVDGEVEVEYLEKRKRPLGRSYRAAFLSVLKGTHYLGEKFANFYKNDDLWKYAERKYDYCYFHLPFSYKPELVFGESVVVIDTHNDDYDSFPVEGAGLSKYVAASTRKALDRIFESLPRGSACVHVSQSDCEKYKARYGRDLDLVCRNGYKKRKLAGKRKSGNKINAYFLGSLCQSFNVQALEFFAGEVYSSVSMHVDFHLLGSSPTAGVVQLASRNGWGLHANLTNAEVDEILREMDVCVMPFQFSFGSKLKMFEAVGSGIPVVVSSVVETDGLGEGDGVFVVRNSEWMERIEDASRWERPMEDSHAVRTGSWEYQVNGMWNDLESNR